VYIAILFSLATTLGGGVWTASSLYSRLESVESRSIPDIAPLEEEVITQNKELLSSIELIKQELSDNDVSQLQGKLATLGANLQTIIEQQDKLLLIDDNVDDLEKQIEGMKATVTKAELVTSKITGFENKINKHTREIEDLWSAMDYLSNPLK
jgi:small-conductance mechanosensitive channel